VNHDDPVYVYDNPFVLQGLTKASIAWAFGRLNGEATYWHPVTWLSHMTDCQIFGLKAGSHHMMNVMFHAVNAVLVFLVLRRITGSVWRSAIVAGLFAWHPLQVDSVAWISERKNVLSTCLWMLTILAYATYAKAKNFEARDEPAKIKANIPAVAFYWLSLCLFAVGLMAKPMLVTTPLLLLILDWWPLRRLNTADYAGTPKSNAGGTPCARTMPRLIFEKLPFAALSAVSATITIVGHQHLGALASDEHLPMSARLANAIVSYVRYLGKMIWPANLTVHYPHPGHWAMGTVVANSAILLAISAVAIARARRQPYLLAGWLWFLVTLLPTIGIIQASSQAMADRFAYVPLIGLFVMIVWLVADIASRCEETSSASSKSGVSLSPRAPILTRARTTAAALVAVATLSACVATARSQLHCWQDSESLFRHALQVAGNDPIIRFSLGGALAQKNKLDDARVQFLEVIKLKPDYAEAHDDLGVIYQLQGKLDAAIAETSEALRLRPDLIRARNNLGAALAAQGKTAEAMAAFRETLRRNPGNAETHYNLGKLLADQKRTSEASAEFSEAIRLKPEYADPHYGLGMLWFAQEKIAEAQGEFENALRINPNIAEAHYQLAVIAQGRKDANQALGHYFEAVRLRPDWPEAINNLAWILATRNDGQSGNGIDAVRLAAHAVELTRTNNPGALDTLAAAYADTGRFEDAVRTLQRAIALADGQKTLIAELQSRLALYQSGKRYQE
jgi:tetratricopeptide (TPR) repeat protein